MVKSQPDPNRRFPSPPSPANFSIDGIPPAEIGDPPLRGASTLLKTCFHRGLPVPSITKPSPKHHSQLEYGSTGAGTGSHSLHPPARRPTTRP